MHEFAFQLAPAPLPAANEVALQSTERRTKALHTVAQEGQEPKGADAEQALQGIVHLFDHDLRYLSSEGSEPGRLGLDGAVMPGTTLWETFPPETCQQLEPLYRAALVGRVLVQEVTHGCQTYRVQTVPARNEQGKLFAGMACIQNISKRKQAEIALRQSEEFKQRMVESSNDCMKVLDLGGRLLYMNSRGRCQMEIDNFESVRYAEWPTFWPGDNRLKAEAAVVAAKAGRTRQFEGYCPTAKGTPKWWDVVVSPIQDADGNVVQLLSVSRDITERKEAEAALQERAEHTQLLYETTRDLLSTTQPLTLIETVFTRLEALLGLDLCLNYVSQEGQQLHLKFYSGISKEMAQEIECLEVGQSICSKAAQQRCQVVQADIQHCDELKTAWLRSHGVTAYACQPLVAQGKLFGTLGFGSRSRTQFSALETSLFQAICDQIAIALERSQLVSSLQQQTEELMRVSRIKDDFLAILSHELRTPLSSILGWAHLLQLKQVGPERIQQGVAMIERSARQQAQLIEDLLDMARIIRGKLSLDLAKIDLADPLTAALETVHLAAEAKSIQLKVLVDPTVGSIKGDADRLQQVVCNLLSNAVKFTPAGGQIHVRLERDEFAASSSQLEYSTPSSALSQATHSFARITVSDNGKGIEPEFLPHVFELFRQQDSSTTRHFGGLGLGLAIASQIIEAHGGTISAASAGEDQGATFTVRLPLIPASKPHLPVATQPQAHNLKNLRVMVVDDDIAVLELIKTFLEHEGMIVWPMSSTVEALQVLAQSQFDLLISDIGMPQMDGYAFIREVRALAPQSNRDIPALAVTAYAGKADQYQALAAGFQAHLAKPIYPQQLLRELMTLLAR